MIQTSPNLFDDTLVYEQQGQRHMLRVGTSEWYCWLSTASTFSMTSPLGTFTVRNERAGSKRGGWYWKMYHRREGKLRSAYLGKAERLTLEQLQATAQRLATRTSPVSRKRESKPALQDRLVEPRAALPVSLTPLIGREQEISRLEDMLCRGEKRLVTLSGMGGVGKTSLALHVARNLASAFADGTAFVPLAAVTKSDDVLMTVASAMGISVREQSLLYMSVSAFLQKKHLLLVLDNFEQVAEAASQIEALVMACPRLFVLTTSRMGLHLRGEQIFPLSPLGLPDPAQAAKPEALLHSPAVSLFIYHAQAHLPSFQLTEANASTVSAICRQLDGLPLALELAAARLPLFSPEVLLTRLSQRLLLLTGGAQSAPKRQQTLRDTLDWSYQLLDPREQWLFRLLSIFVGGFTLSAVESIVSVIGEKSVDVVHGLASLLDKNLIQRDDQPASEPRLRLLETMREYACEQFFGQDENEQQAARDAHAGFYLLLAEEAGARYGDTFHLLLPHLGPEHDNLRASLRWFLHQDNMLAAFRLGCALEWFWIGGSYWSEGRWWLEQLLVHRHAVETRELARTLTVAGKLAQMQGEYDSAECRGREGLALFRQLGDTKGIIAALSHLAYTEIERGAYEHAVELAEEAYTLERHEESYTRGIHCTLIRALIFAGVYERAEELAREVQSMSRQRNDQTGMPVVYTTLGVIALIHNDLPKAQMLLEAGASGYQGVGFVRLVLETRGMLAFLAIQQAAMRSARMKYLELAEQCLSYGDAAYTPFVLALVLRGLGIIAAQEGNPFEAARLWGAAEQLNRNMFPFERKLHTGQVTATRALLGETLFARAWNEGAQLPPEALLSAHEQGIWRTAEEISRSTPSRPKTSSSMIDALTTREIAVLRLLAEGKTDRQIAEQLVISPRTVNTHVTSLYRKIGVNSRSAATRYATEHDVLLIS